MAHHVHLWCSMCAAGQALDRATHQCWTQSQKWDFLIRTQPNPYNSIHNPYMPTHTHTCARMNAQMCRHECTTHTHACTHARTYTIQAGKIWDSRHTHMEICVSINTLHTYIHTYVRMYVCTYVLTVTVTPDNSKKSVRIQYYENIIMTGN